MLHNKIFFSKAKRILFDQTTVMHPDTKQCAVGDYPLCVRKLLTSAHCEVSAA
jgi:hypothetical protein